jgi:hypothetical protein
MNKHSSIVTLPRESLNPIIWDISTDPPFIRGEVRNLLLNTLYITLEEYCYFDSSDSWIESINFVGSAATYQYTQDTDIDIHFQINWDKFYKHNPSLIGLDEEEVAKGMRRHLDDTLYDFYIDGHIVTYYPQVNELQDYWGDAFYDLLDNEWIISPPVIPIEFSPETDLQDAWSIANSHLKDFDILIGELQRDVYDYFKLVKWIDTISEERKTTLFSRVSNKAQEIGDAIELAIEKFKSLHEGRKKSFTEDMPEKDMYGWSKSWNTGNIVWKIFEKYDYIKLVAELRKVYDNRESELLNEKEIILIDNILNEWF